MAGRLGRWKAGAVRLGLVLGLCLAPAAATLGWVPGATAKPRPKTHLIFKGQTLGKIAKRYNITVEVLCHANAIGEHDAIKPGKRLYIPPRSDVDGSKTRARVEALTGKKSDKSSKAAGKASAKDDTGKPPTRAALKTGVRWHEVYKKQKLGSIARRYHVTVDALCHANGIEKKTPIQPGQWLIVPHAKDTGGDVAREVLDAGATPPAADEAATNGATSKTTGKGAKHSWTPYLAKPKRRRWLSLMGRKGREWEGVAVTRKGKATKKAKAAFERVLATRGGQKKAIDPRLISLIAKVSDAFGGRPIRVVSGLRLGQTARGSRHRHGRAVDFVVDGVPNEALRDFVKTFDDVGVGYYPNSHFVHLDVRKQWTYWIDLSAPGQRPRYAGFWTRRAR
jgi:uncharacterized protein YcbK (DUF882 family)